MSAPRFFAPLPPHRGGPLELPERVVHHARDVLRLREGDAIVLFDGEGGEYDATLARIDKRGATATLGVFRDIDRDAALDITLVQSLVGAEKMDWIIQKATELGVNAIQPILTERSTAKFAHEREEKKRAHWREVAIAACEQCGRNRVPEIRAPLGFAAWLAQEQASVRFLDGTGLEGASLLASGQGPIAIAVGPEGGFTADELDLARSRGHAVVRLGPRTLRTETAGIAAISAVQALAGDFR